MISLYPYQQKYLDTASPSFIFDCDTGTGKTIMALEHFLKHRKSEQEHLLIVAPASKIKEGGWQRTIQEHYKQIVNVEFISYNNLKKYNENFDYDKLQNIFLIFDEAHRIKNSTGVWGKQAYRLRLRANNFILLSATLLSNGWIDSINYFKFFGMIKNKTEFLNKYCVLEKKHWGGHEVVGYRDIHYLESSYNKISNRLNKEDANELPDLIEQKRYFKKSGDYNKIKKTRMHQEQPLDTNIKLRHCLRQNVTKDKINYLVEQVEATNENIVIFYNYNEELDQIKDALEKTNKTIFEVNGSSFNIPVKQDWSEVTNSVTLANYKSGSEAVELTYCSIAIYYSLCESYTDYYQSIGRFYRNGQNKKCSMYLYITPDTIEENIFNSLSNKQDFNFDIWYSSSTNK